MIKGVSRQIIEMTETDSAYYERALLVVKPEYASVERSFLEREAKKMLKNMDSPSVMKPRRAFLFWFLRLGGAATLGALLGAVLMKLFS